ncbi:hypothetical protein ACFPM7_24830 [Actinokineospora guangxiensis]|uniref:ABC-type branched-subunit amino acid transport system substrate-binding protein n=1 Tax=Actinokineospora guangxiensis TaxID=1490288 RepID=A0ABW0EU59_9PSEU
MVTFVRTLCRRPGFFQRDERLLMRGDLPLPMVCLLRDGPADGFTAQLGAAFEEGPTRVPHVVVDIAKPVEPGPVLPLLHAIYERLAKGQFGRKGSLTRFDNYRLVHLLTTSTLPPRQARGEEPVKELLRAWARKPSLGAQDTADRAGERVALVVATLKLAGYLVGVYWGRDRVPGLARERRWLLRQPYMVPKHSPDFLRFAERLTVSRRADENTDQLHKLLVHAFLEDLRLAYRRTWWGFLPRRAGWRRTAHVTALLDNAHADGGWELLRLINEVRNETGELDPLLVVAEAHSPPPGVPRPEHVAEPSRPTDARDALVAWKRRLPGSRQKLASDARYLFVTLPAAGVPGALDAGDAEVWEAGDDVAPPPVPWPARRGVAEVIAAVVLVAALTPVTVTMSNHWGAGCAFFRAVSGGIATQVVHIDGKDQCIGYSDNAGQVFSTNPRLQRAQLEVFEQNEVADRLHSETDDRPLVTVVYLAGLTVNGNVPATEHSVAEEVEGLLIRQREQNTSTSRAEPLLRVIIANGGTGMAAADILVTDMIIPLIESDPTILGVIGLDRSVDTTETAIRELGMRGIPALGSTLTAVGLGTLSAQYFQLVPDNTVQADLITRLAQRTRATRVTIFHPPLDGANNYATTLVDVTAKALRKANIKVGVQGWTTSAAELALQCDDTTDRRSEIAFYAGREVDFSDFVQALRRQCADPTRLPRIVADDSVSRFVAHAPGRRVNHLNGVRMSYVSLGAQVVIAGDRCVAGAPGALPGATPALDAFCAGYAQLRREVFVDLEEDQQPLATWAGERVGVAYDAAGFYVEAVRTLRRDYLTVVPNRASVSMVFRELEFQGATGLISFRTSRIANTRSLAILNVENIHDTSGPAGTPRCELMIGDLGRESGGRQGNGCPEVASR